MKNKIVVDLPSIDLGRIGTVADFTESLRQSLGCVPPDEQGQVQMHVRYDPEWDEAKLEFVYVRLETNDEQDARLALFSRQEKQLQLQAQGRTDSDRQHRKDMYEMLKKEFEP